MGRRGQIGIGLLLACFLLLPALPAQATVLPSGFREEVIYSGLEEPMALSIAADGKVFVAEKAGKVKVFEDFEDETPQVFADLRTEVYDTGDRGIMGMELDPDFPASPYVYVLYTYDAILNVDPDDPNFAEESQIPRWGTPDTTGDPCPKPAGENEVNGCPVFGRLVRLTAGGPGGTEAIAEKPLVEGWCQQFVSHSVGDLQFDSQGFLYASGGDGAKASTTDHGQFGWPKKNQCGDPPGGIGGAMTPPTAEGGALRTQDLRTPNPLGLTADPTGLNGSIIRVDPETGAGVPGNPLFGSLDANERRIVAYGFRNPFRFEVDQADDELYVSNVGWTEWEEIDRFRVDSDEPWNSGWPCYEGPEVNIAYRNLETNLCEGLYAEPGAAGPAIFNYSFGGPLFPGDPCPTENGAAITGISVYRDSAFPPAYDGALFFADSVRECIYVMFPGDDGRPDPTTTTIFASDAGFYPAVELEVGPDGNLYYLNLFTDSEGGTVRRVSYDPGVPDADLAATPTFGAADPLEVELDASGSTDPDGEALTYDWDLDGNGSFETVNGGAERTEEVEGPDSVRIRVRVKDAGGATNVAQVVVHPGNTPPEPQIDEPLGSLEWKVGEKIDFFGFATDPQDGSVPDEDLHWRVRLHHCRAIGDCHAHPLQVLPSLEEGSFTAPDHEYPAFLEIILTATDSQGLSAVENVEIHPRTVDLQIASKPSGLTLSAGVKSALTPFTVTAIEGSNVGLSAPLTQGLGGDTYNWTAWSQGGSNVQNIVASQSATYTAIYAREGEEGGADDGGTSPDSGARRKKQAVAPRTRLLWHPAKRTRRSTARFRFSADAGNVTFRCKLDGRPLVPCRSPRVYRNLSPGRHVFTVLAIAASGSRGRTPSVFRWRVLPERDDG
jgi:YD repeat-containing protein